MTTWSEGFERYQALGGKLDREAHNYLTRAIKECSAESPRIDQVAQRISDETGITLTRKTRVAYRLLISNRFIARTLNGGQSFRTLESKGALLREAAALTGDVENSIRMNPMPQKKQDESSRGKNGSGIS